MSGFLNLLKVAQHHLVVILTLGADLLEEMHKQVMPVHLISNLYWGTIVKYTLLLQFYYSSH